MTRQRYSTKEAWNRVLRAYQGKATSSEQPNTLDGEVLSENQAISDFAELIVGSLPNESGELPSGISVPGTGNVEYGEIYNNSTGTAVVALSTSWKKVTGSFQGETLSSGNIVPDYLNDKITINHIGTFFVGLQCSFSGSNNAVVEACVYLNGVRQESVRFRRKLGTGGDVGSASAIGIISVTGTGVDLELYARADSGTPNFKLESGQLWIYAFP